MSKKEMDDYFVEILPMLEKIVKGVAYKNNKKIDTNAAINEAYLHMTRYDISTKKDLEKLVVNFLNMNIQWTNSKLNKQERVGQHNDKLNTKSFYGGSDDDTSTENFKPKEEPTDEMDVELETKILIEKWWDEKQCILQMYRDQEKDKIKQIIYDCYFKKNITKGVDLAKHLGVNKDYSSKYIREMKNEIKDFYENYLQNNNI
jgi:hypothetical protein